ncbi:MAG: GntR family transcriptional regulator [Anaerolineae bacterium]|nr:GntR family transcriptional regulator [Anaerolineae bacterium]
MESDQNNEVSRSRFQRLQSQLANIIAETPSGQRLTAEPDLAKELGVSRATLREAMRTFEGQGLIRRRQGVGTFVVGHPQVIDTGLEVLESIETLARKIHLDVSIGAMVIDNVLATQEYAQALQVPVEMTLCRVVRTILADSRPVAYLIDILPQDVLTPSDLEDNFSGSVLDLLLKRQASNISNSLTEIQAVAAPSEIARALEIQRGDVLLKMTARLVAVSGRTLDYSFSYFIPGYFRFHVVRRIGGIAFNG